MKKTKLSLLLFSSLLLADDYSFDIDEFETIEVKNYNYSGYLKAIYKNQQPNNTHNYYGEGLVDLNYIKDDYKLTSQFIANYKNIDKKEDDTQTINQLFLNYKLDDNHQLNIGKISSRWGKGYFFNPVGFIDRKKDPYNPEASKEGYVLLNYRYNKTYQNSSLKNLTFDLTYLPTRGDNDLDDKDSNNIAFKLYTLLYDIDIDLIYIYNDRYQNKLGVDFSANIQTNFELHGEYARYDDHFYSYLFGLKYLTDFELTITSEYFYQDKTLAKTEPFWDNRYFVNKLLLKEPFDILYSSIYLKSNLNIKDNSHQMSLGGIYNFKNSIDLDISVGKNFGDEKSEYGMKKADQFFSCELKWSF